MSSNNIVYTTEGEYTVGKIDGIERERFITPRTSPILSPCVSQSSYRNQFTLAEKRDLYTKALTDVDLRIVLEDLSATTIVHMLDPRVVFGLSVLVSKGVLTQPRADLILAYRE